MQRFRDIRGMSLVGYARVSTSDQNPALQHDALDAAGCTRTFTDTASGALDQRLQLSAALDYLRPGDVLTVWRLDRLGRSVRHLTATVNTLAERGVGFRSLTEGIDTTTPAGKLVFHIFASLAEFEREIIRERTNAGLEAARARGRTGGRRPKMTPGKLATARQLYEGKEHTMAQIAEIIGVSRATLYRHLEPDTQPVTTG
jgi:DNA invertase Pin-like site-specific DNA recombinase